MVALTGRRVPVARRLLFVRPARLLVAVLGVGVAVMLILLLGGLWSGVQQQVTKFEDHTGAQLVVVSPGTENLFADSSVLSSATTGQVARTPGVSWAAPIRTLYTIVDLHGGKAAAALVGARPGQPGSPWALAEGSAPAEDTEVAIDEGFAERHGLAVGDRVPITGKDFRVVGLTSDSGMFMTPLIFVTERAASELLQSPDTVGSVLVGTSQPKETADRLRARGLTVRSIGDLREAGLRLSTQIYGSPLRLMVAVAFLAGTLLVALSGYTVIIEHQRELGVLKALGATNRRLASLALTQTLTLAAAGGVAGLGLLFAVIPLIGAWRPQFPIVVTGGSLVTTALTVLGMAVLAAGVPVRRLSRLDAATAFRGVR